MICEFLSPNPASALELGHWVAPVRLFFDPNPATFPRVGHMVLSEFSFSVSELFIALFTERDFGNLGTLNFE